jgi:hypothetical protein
MPWKDSTIAALDCYVSLAGQTAFKGLPVGVAKGDEIGKMVEISLVLFQVLNRHSPNRVSPALSESLHTPLDLSDRGIITWSVCKMLATTSTISSWLSDQLSCPSF